MFELTKCDKQILSEKRPPRDKTRSSVNNLLRMRSKQASHGSIVCVQDAKKCLKLQPAVD